MEHSEHFPKTLGYTSFLFISKMEEPELYVRKDSGNGTQLIADNLIQYCSENILQNRPLDMVT